MKIQLTEQIIISNKHKYYAMLDELCFMSKNLYNVAIYNIRQRYENDGSYLRYTNLNRLLHDTKNIDYYNMVYVQSAQQVLRQVDKIYVSFFKGIKAEKNKGKSVKPPRFKDKNGRNVFVYTNQTASLKNGILKLKTKQGYAYINTTVDNFQQVRLIPKGNHIIVEIIYNKEYELKDDNGRYAGIDIGINNICTLTSNAAQSILYNGRQIKSINRYYNKHKAKLQSKLASKKYTSRRISRITNKRNNKVKDYLHKLSRSIINYLVLNSLNTLIVGKNVGWKDSINLGKTNNQNFVSIPYNMLIDMLSYKCKLAGINMIIVNEAYSSKCSFLDNEKICKHKSYQGKRIKRGLFVSNAGIRINADVNASYNIIRIGLSIIHAKLDALSIRPENMRFVLNPVSILIL